MKKTLILFFVVCLLFAFSPVEMTPAFRVLVVTSKAKDHIRMMECAGPMLREIASANNFEVEVTDDTSKINPANLKRFQVFVMLQLAPFDMSPAQQEALQQFASDGHGWVGIHAGGLTGKSFVKPNRTYWQWFEDFMGGIVYSPHPAFQKGTVIIEDRNHPITKGLPERFEVSDEWYEFDKSPRPNVHVIARADESTYKQNKPMGDHPIIWVNEKFWRMVYIGIGHDASLCTDKNYQSLLTNAIRWSATKK